MKTLMENWNRFVNEEEQAVNEQEQDLYSLVSPYTEQFAKTGEAMADMLAAKGSPQIKLTKDVYSKASTKDLLGPSGELTLELGDMMRSDPEAFEKKYNVKGINQLVEKIRTNLMLTALRSMSRRLDSLGYKISKAQNASNEESAIAYATWTKE